MAVHLTELLTLDCLKFAHVLAGFKGLTNEVRSIDVLEAPDAIQQLQPHMLILTTGYVLRDNPDLQRDLLVNIAGAGAAGLAIKAGGYLSPVPQAMVDLANELNVPIIEIPKAVPYVDIINAGLGMIFANQTALLQRAQDTHLQFSEVALRGGDTGAIAATLAQLVGSAVIIADADLNSLAFAPAPEGVRPAKRLQYADGHPDQWVHILEKIGLLERVKIQRAITRCEINLSRQGEQVWVVAPIASGEAVYGYILIREEGLKLTRYDLVAVEQACMVAAMCIFRQRSLEELEQRLRNDFLAALLAGEIKDETLVRERAGYFNWAIAPDMGYGVMLARLDNYDQYYRTHYSPGNGRRYQEVKQRLLGVAGACAADLNKGGIVGQKNEMLVFIFPQAPSGDSRGAALDLAWRLKRAVAAKLPEIEVAIGVGNVYRDILRLPTAYQEALQALAVGRAVPSEHSIWHFSDTGVYRLLFALQGLKELRQFYTETLGPLLQDDAESGKEMLKTLAVYFRCNGNLNRTAELLFIHRNSLTYRLEKIQQLLNVDLHNADHRFKLQLALKLLEFYTKCTTGNGKLAAP